MLPQGSLHPTRRRAQGCPVSVRRRAPGTAPTMNRRMSSALASARSSSEWRRAATVVSESRSCARSARRWIMASFEPKWCAGRARLIPERVPMLVSDARSMPRSAMTAAAASRSASSDWLRRSACVRRGFPGDVAAMVSGCAVPKQLAGCRVGALAVDERRHAVDDDPVVARRPSGPGATRRPGSRTARSCVEGSRPCRGRRRSRRPACPRRASRGPSGRPPSPGRRRGASAPPRAT